LEEYKDKTKQELSDEKCKLHAICCTLEAHHGMCICNPSTRYPKGQQGNRKPSLTKYLVKLHVDQEMGGSKT